MYVAYLSEELARSLQAGMYPSANPDPGRPSGRDGHRAVRPPEPPSGRPNGGGAERSDYHAAQMLQLQMLQLQMLQMQRMWQLMRQFAQTQQQNWDMGSRNGMGLPSMQNTQLMQHRYPGEGERERERERERDLTRESRGVRGGDAGGYRRDNYGKNAQGPSRRNVEINKQITVCEDSRDLCALIDAHAAEFNSCNVATAFRKLLQSRRESLPSGVVERTLQALEAAALRMIDAFEAQGVVNVLHIIAQTRYSPCDQSLVPKLEGRAEALAGTFNAHGGGQHCGRMRRWRGSLGRA